MTEYRFIVVSDAGSPEHPRTWSGTPSNIIKALRAAGHQVVPLDVTLKRPTRAALKLLSMKCGTGREYRRTKLTAPFYRHKIAGVAVDDADVFLHTSSTTIPQYRQGRRGRHVLFLDSTYHILSRYAGANVSPSLVRLYDSFDRGAVQSADHIFAIGDHIKADICSHYSVGEDRVTVTGTGTGSIRPSSGKKDYSTYTTLFVAKQRFEEKGGLLLLEGFRLAQQRDPRLKLTVVAQENYRAVVEEIPGTTFKTSLPWEALEACFNSAALYAMPATYEPWGLVYLEALKCRTPILGLNRNALPEFTQKGRYGILVEEAYAKAVAEGLLAAFSDLGRLSEMGEQGQAYVMSRYGWDKVAMRICQALDQTSTPSTAR